MKTEKEIREKLPVMMENSNGLDEDGTWVCRCFEEGWVEALEWVLDEEKNRYDKK